MVMIIPYKAHSVYILEFVCQALSQSWQIALGKYNMSRRTDHEIHV